jgi:hypothetical protein
MAAPTYTCEFNSDLFGNRVPKIVTLEASSNLETKIGTALIATGGQVDEATASVQLFLGLAAQATTAAATAGDPIKVELIAPGMVIKGTADADASALSGFSGKTGDFNSDGSLDVADTTNGCLCVLRTENSGLTVYCTINAARMAAI